MRRGVRSARSVAAVITMLVGVTFTGSCGQQSGEVGRTPAGDGGGVSAYPVDSGDITLEEGLKRADVTAPKCLRDDLRYALVDDGFGYHYRVYLGTRSTVECMDRFLAVNGMRNAVTGSPRVDGSDQDRPLTNRSPWMDADTIAELGWQVGPDQRFQKFGVTKGNLYTVFALVRHVPGSPEVQAYVHAFHGG